MYMQYLIAVTIIAWGVGSLFYKVANDNIHPIMVSTIVTGVYFVITPLTFWLYKFPKDVNLAGVSFSIMGGICMAVGSIAYFYALKKGGAGEITTVTALYPALTLLISMLFLKETINYKQGIGVFLALVSFVLLGLK